MGDDPEAGVFADVIELSIFIRNRTPSGVTFLRLRLALQKDNFRWLQLRGMYHGF